MINALLYLLVGIVGIAIGYGGRCIYAKLKLTSAEQRAKVLEENALKNADAKAKEIIAATSAEKAASLNMNMIENIAKGRVNKFYKESCLLNQEFIQDSKMTVKQYLEAADKDLTIVDFKRFSLVAD